MKYVLDTDVCINLIKNNPKVIKKLSYVSVGDLYISVITEGELWYGLSKSSHFAKSLEILERFLSCLQRLPFTSTDAKSYGFLRQNLEKSGRIIGNNDLLIASQVLDIDGVLVTGNEREFRRIKDLKVENWLK